MKKALIFIKNNINPHFIVYYNYFKCNKVNDDDIKGFYNYIFKEYFYIIIMELFEGDTTKILYNMNIDNIIKKNVNTQIFLSLLSFHILLKVKHNDVKHANFFYKKIKSNDYDYIHYIIYDINVYVKNMGYIIVIGDYGQCDINNTEENKLDDYAIIEELGIKNYFYKSINENPIKTIKNFTTEKEYILYLINHTDIFNKTLPVDGITLNNKPFILK